MQLPKDTNKYFYNYVTIIVGTKVIVPQSLLVNFTRFEAKMCHLVICVCVWLRESVQTFTKYYFVNITQPVLAFNEKCIIYPFKGDLTHTVSPNLMLILSTYRVVLHPSYLQKVFSFIIFIKERYRFTILSEKSRTPGGVPCGRS